MRDGDTVEEVIERVSRRRLTYLPKPALQDLADAVAETEAQQRKGFIVECGTALGGSAIVMAAAKSPTRRMRVYDMFGTIPPPSDNDGEKVQQRYESIARGESKGLGGDIYYGYVDDLKEQVRKSFRQQGVPIRDNAVQLIEGDFRDTLVVDYPVVLAHLDGDWYESTMVCLERIVPQLVPGGRLIIDDYHFWEGCRKAVDEYFLDRKGFEQVRKERLHIIKL